MMTRGDERTRDNTESEPSSTKKPLLDTLRPRRSRTASVPQREVQYLVVERLGVGVAPFGEVGQEPDVDGESLALKPPAAPRQQAAASDGSTRRNRGRAQGCDPPKFYGRWANATLRRREVQD